MKKVISHSSLLCFWLSGLSACVFADSHYLSTTEEIDPSVDYSRFDLDGPHLLSTYRDSSNTERLSKRNLDTDQEVIIDSNGSSNSAFFFPRIDSNTIVWVEKNYATDGSYTNSTVKYDSPDNDVGTFPDIAGVDVKGNHVMVRFHNDLLPSTFPADKLILIDSQDDSQVTLTEFYAARDRPAAGFAFTENRYAFIEFNDKYWNTNSNPEKLVFNDGATTTTFIFPALNVESPLLIAGDSLYFVNEDDHSVSRMQGGAVIPELQLEPYETLNCLVKEGDIVLMGVNDSSAGTFSIYERASDGLFSTLLTMDGELQKISLGSSGFFLSVDHAGLYLLYFQRGKGVSVLDTLNFFSSEIYSYANTVVTRDFKFRNMVPVTTMIKRIIDEIPLPLPGEYVSDIEIDFGSNVVSTVSQIMQGKDLVLQSSHDLAFGEWIDVDTKRYLSDGIATQTVSMASVIDAMVMHEYELNPALTSEELEGIRVDLEQGPMFFRSMLRY